MTPPAIVALGTLACAITASAAACGWTWRSHDPGEGEEGAVPRSLEAAHAELDELLGIVRPGEAEGDAPTAADDAATRPRIARASDGEGGPHPRHAP